MGSEFERAVAIVELEFPSMGFRFRRTANTLPHVESGDEVDLAAIRMGTIGDGGEE
jgi:hypothetical protein